jgi:hypothetical protein
MDCWFREQAMRQGATTLLKQPNVARLQLLLLRRGGKTLTPCCLTNKLFYY